MGTDPDITAMAFHRYGEVDLGRMSVRVWFVSYKCEASGPITLRAGTVPGNEVVKSGDDAPTSLTLPAMPVYFCCGASRIIFETVQRDYNKYRNPADKPDKDGREEAVKGADLDAFLEEKMLCKQERNAGDKSKEEVDATWLFVTAVGHNDVSSKKGSLDLVHTLAGKVQRAQRKSDATVVQLSKKNEKMGAAVEGPSFDWWLRRDIWFEEAVE